MDYHEAYNALLEPLRGDFYIDTHALDSIPIAIMAHDPAIDLAKMLAYHDIEIDVTDPRAVQNLLENNFNLRVEMTATMPSDPFLKLHDNVMMLPEIPTSEHWSNAERILSSVTNDRIAKAIISAVDRLATLIRAEKIVERLKSDDPRPAEARSSEPGSKPQPRRPGGNDFNI